MASQTKTSLNWTAAETKLRRSHMHTALEVQIQMRHAVCGRPSQLHPPNSEPFLAMDVLSGKGSEVALLVAEALVWLFRMLTTLGLILTAGTPR